MDLKRNCRQYLPASASASKKTHNFCSPGCFQPICGRACQHQNMSDLQTQTGRREVGSATFHACCQTSPDKSQVISFGRQISWPMYFTLTKLFSMSKMQRHGCLHLHPTEPHKSAHRARACQVVSRENVYEKRPKGHEKFHSKRSLESKVH